MSLLRFYQVWGYEERRNTDNLDAATDSDEPSDSSNQSSIPPISLETAVRLNLEVAHRVLATHLGLSYENVEKFIERAQQLGLAHEKRPTK